LYCIVLYCIVLYCIVLYCIVLYCIVLYCIALHGIALHGIVSYETSVSHLTLLPVCLCSVNVVSHFWTIKAFLGDMLLHNNGHIVTIASVYATLRILMLRCSVLFIQILQCLIVVNWYVHSAGLAGACGIVDYCASKFAAVGLDEALRFELRASGKTGLRMCLFECHL
jgi:hypothetical protein